jgi:hypothetical protein
MIHTLIFILSNQLLSMANSFSNQVVILVNILDITVLIFAFGLQRPVLNFPLLSTFVLASFMSLLVSRCIDNNSCTVILSFSRPDLQGSRTLDKSSASALEAHRSRLASVLPD